MTNKKRFEWVSYFRLAVNPLLFDAAHFVFRIEAEKKSFVFLQYNNFCRRRFVLKHFRLFGFTALCQIEFLKTYFGLDEQTMNVCRFSVY